MITWLVGENSFEIREALQKIISAPSGTQEQIMPEKFDGIDLKFTDLPDLLMGMSLFSSKRLIIIDNISANQSLWEKLPELLERVSDDVHLVLVDTKPDKRTTVYKAIKSVADYHEFPLLEDHDRPKAETWLKERAKTLGVKLDSRSAAHLISKVGLDQWQLASALEILSLLDEISPQLIDETIAASPAENIFQLFEVAIEGDTKAVASRLATLELQEDPYALFALLSSQALNLAAMALADETDNPTKDFAIHPYVASKMSRQAKRLGKRKVAQIVELFAQTDADMKRSKAEPWTLIERLLLKVATIS